MSEKTVYPFVRVIEAYSREELEYWVNVALQEGLFVLRVVPVITPFFMSWILFVGNKKSQKRFDGFQVAFWFYYKRKVRE